CLFCFFFQAEGGIRYFHVTGVQTCALPISVGPVSPLSLSSSSFLHELNEAKAIAQAKNNNSQFFLFINYLNFVYNIFNFIFGFAFSNAITAVLNELNKLGLVALKYNDVLS